MPPKKAKAKGPAGADDGTFRDFAENMLPILLCVSASAALSILSCVACAVDVNKQLRDNYVKACKCVHPAPVAPSTSSGVTGDHIFLQHVLT